MTDVRHAVRLLRTANLDGNAHRCGAAVYRLPEVAAPLHSAQIRSTVTGGYLHQRSADMIDRDAHSFNVIEPCMLHLKLEVPRQRIPLVARPRLLSQLTAIASHRLCLVIAPAGFGKTTILAQWSDHLARSGCRVAWLTLDEEDGDARHLLACTVFALSKAGLDMGRVLPHAEQGLVEITPDGCVLMIAEALAQCSSPVVLVLDDYHRASSAVINALLLRLAQISPDDFTLVLSSRVRPSIGVPQLLASGLASEINSDTLRLTSGEMIALLDTDLCESELATLADQTEGWPVALQLARLVLKNDRSPSQAIRQLTSRGGHLSTYLAEQVLETLPEALKDFLIETSVLERFNVGLANAVRSRSDSWAVIEALEPLQSLLTPLDSGDGWFRYHHLFAEYLRDLLARQRPHDVARLHLLASYWFQQNGFVLEAVRHARAAGDFNRCAELIEEAGGWQLILYGGINFLRSLLRFVPEAERDAHPRLLFAQSYLDMKDGRLQPARDNFLLAEDFIRRTDVPERLAEELKRDALNLGVLLKIYEDDPLDDEMLDFVGLKTVVSATDGLTLGILDCAAAVIALCIGRLHQAETIARSAMKSMRSASSVLGLNYCYLHAGMATLYRGELATSSAYLMEARRMAEENFGADSGLKSIADVLCGALHFWRNGELDVPATDYARSTQHVHVYDGWFDIYAAGLDVRFRMALAAGGASEMRAIIGEGQALLAERGLRRLAIVLQSYRLMLALHQGLRAEAKLLGRGLQEELQLGCWRERSRLWRPYQDGGLALARWQEETDRSLALRTLTDVVNCAKATGATLPLIRALVRRAVLHDTLGRRPAAVEDLGRAITLAAPERIAQPFKEQDDVGVLLRLIKEHLRQEAGDPIQVNFVSELLGDLAVPPLDASGSARELLSRRERDVVQELCQGLTNKEIARALDMTEHTVKFHLRNIFAKLGVERRAQALAVFQSRNYRMRA